MPRNIHDVLRQKELDLERIQKEVDALKIVAPLLTSEEDQPKQQPGPTPVPKVDIVTAPAPTTPTTVKTAPDWNNTAKRWP